MPKAQKYLVTPGPPTSDGYSWWVEITGPSLRKGEVYGVWFVRRDSMSYRPVSEEDVKLVIKLLEADPSILDRAHPESIRYPDEIIRHILCLTIR